MVVFQKKQTYNNYTTSIEFEFDLCIQEMVVKNI